MVYWDNAATTWPKPPSVEQAALLAMRRYGGNPGRGGHQMSLQTAEQVYACREVVAAFFGLQDATGVVFMPNCTAALNTVIAGVLAGGGRAVISDLEHNAVWRPLHGLGGQRYDIVPWSADEEELLANFRRAIRPDTRLMICTHASNVFGVVLPIRRLASLAHEYRLLFCVDAAQSAGVLPIDMEKDDIDYLCVAAHKGLYAPMGTGVLLCRNRRPIPPLVRGGTGSYSAHPEQPEELPDRLESGTQNGVGICGLLAGLRFVQRRGRETIYAHEMGLIQQVYDRLAGQPGIRLYTPRPLPGQAVPLLSIRVEGQSPEQTAALLDRRGVAVRAGLHCAPLAHRHFGTLPQGTVRLAPGVFSTQAQADYVAKLFLQFAQKPLQE